MGLTVVCVLCGRSDPLAEMRKTLVAGLYAHTARCPSSVPRAQMTVAEQEADNVSRAITRRDPVEAACAADKETSDAREALLLRAQKALIALLEELESHREAAAVARSTAA